MLGLAPAPKPFVTPEPICSVTFAAELRNACASVLMAMNLQTSFLTPPFGFSLFYLRGVAPEEVKTTDIYKGVLPFIGIQIVALIFVATVPIVTQPAQMWNTVQEFMFDTEAQSIEECRAECDSDEKAKDRLLEAELSNPGTKELRVQCKSECEKNLEF